MLVKMLGRFAGGLSKEEAALFSAVGFSMSLFSSYRRIPVGSLLIA
jgi:hypothetical protein